MTPRITLISQGVPPPPPPRDRASRGDLVLSLVNVTAAMGDRIKTLEARVAELERQIAAGKDGAA